MLTNLTPTYTFSLTKPEIGSGTKKSGKLSRLVRRRESKRDRYTPAKSQNGSQQQQESSDNDSSTYYGQLKTFESVFECKWWHLLLDIIQSV